MDISKLRGNIISFEGGEGCGKTTQIKAIKTYLENQGLRVEVLREPGGSSIAEQIRGIILDKENTEMTGLCEAFLYASARAQLMEEKVFSLVKKGVVILLDRYVDSSYCYQGIVRGIGLDKVIMLNELAVKETYPDITFLLNVTPEVGLKRVFSGNREVNRLDLETIEFHQKVHNGYLTLAEKYSDRYIIIDADKSVEDVYSDIVKSLEFLY